MRNARKWQILTVGVIGGLILGINIFYLSWGIEINIIVMFDLVLGLVSLLLAMYVYNKEKKLEMRVNSITADKTKEAYRDILENILIFGRMLDDIFIDSYKRQDTYVEIGDLVNIQLHHRNLRLVFNAHIDVIGKNVMGRLAQHISLLEIYVVDHRVKIRQHMDNMHDMDGLITFLKENSDDDQIAEKLDTDTMRKQRQNRFVIYFLDQLSQIATSTMSAADKRIKITFFTNGILYYVGNDNTFEDQDLKQTESDTSQVGKIGNTAEYIMRELATMDKFLADENMKEYVSAIDSLISNIMEKDKALAMKNRTQIEMLADYALITNPFIFLIEILEKIWSGSDDVQSPWNHTVNIRVSSIIDIIDKECVNMLADEQEYIRKSFNALLDFPGSISECIEKMHELKTHLITNRNNILQSFS